jgi:hypothetical protein
MEKRSAIEELALALSLSSVDRPSWEHQERAVYTLEAMEEEMTSMLSPKVKDSDKNGEEHRIQF